MESLLTYSDRGYEVEIWKDDQEYIADIKHPCGELIEGYCHLDSKKEAVYKAVCFVNNLGFAYHANCESEYCLNNRFLSIFHKQFKEKNDVEKQPD